MTGLPDPLVLAVGLLLVAIVPFLIVMTTSFAKLAIVFFILRNALGIQQTPPNLVLYGVAIVFTVYIMAPVFGGMFAEISAADIDFENLSGVVEAGSRALVPLQAFLERFAQPEERAFFLDATAAIWPEEAREGVTADSLIVILPAFVLSELTRAFEIGFMIYLPFIAIDLVIANILLAMGMIMVSPMMISLPFKLLLFVLVDGWNKLMHGLVLSYAG